MAEIPNQQDHDLLIRLDEKVNLLVNKMDAFDRNYNDRLSAVEHDKVDITLYNEHMKIHKDLQDKFDKLSDATEKNKVAIIKIVAVAGTVFALIQIVISVIFKI